ncbi:MULTISPECIES: amidase [unclassified Blastococcus]|uniref:amidase n=1 Tax=unclassified Blastococcus TaxID=2619396 RepID=UPI001EED3A56|nr:MULTISPECIES: amidase [unclassified Blastococcus]
MSMTCDRWSKTPLATRRRETAPMTTRPDAAPAGTPLWKRGAGELAGLIATGAVTSSEVVDAHLDRIDEVNGHVNAVVRVLRDEARAAAREADRAVAEGRPLGPLHGVPCTVKENVDVAGTPTTEGIPALAEAVAAQDAPLVERLRAAGAIPIGRTNMPDFALRIHTDSSLHGLTRNPWDPTVTAGGSSGGDAAALAAGMTPLGIGNDIGGSLRNPAHACGIASIKPTTGRVPEAHANEPFDAGLSVQLMQVNGVMARTVADVRLGLSVIAGPHVRDATTVPVPLELPRPQGPLRVALIAAPPGGETDPGVEDVVRRAGDTLQAAGYEVEEVLPPMYEQALDVWGRWLLADVRAMRPLLQQLMGADGMRFLDFVDPLYAELTVETLVQTFVERRTIARQWAEFMARYPLMLSPIWTQPAFKAGFDIDSAESAAATIRLLRPVMPANVLGLPAAAVAGGTTGGLPVGVQVIGDRFQELLCLEAAEEIERAVGVLTPIDPVR